MAIDMGDSQQNQHPKVPANIPDAFEMDSTDQKSIMMSLRRFDRNGAKDYDIQMDQTAKLTAATHKWNFHHSATKYSHDGPKEEFTFELQQDDSMDFVFRPDICTMTIEIPRKEFEKFSQLENDKEEQITLIVGLTVVSSSGFRNRSRITYDFSAVTENSDLKLVFSGEECIYIDSGYISHLSSYFVGLRRRLSELPKDDCGLPFETFSDINREEFVTLLRIVYPSHEKIDDENVPFLLPLADRFLFEGLLGEIEKYLMSSEMDVVLKLEYASMYQMAELQSHIFSKLSCRIELQKLKDSSYYSNLSVEVMSFLFKKLIDDDFEILNKRTFRTYPAPRDQNAQNLYLGQPGPDVLLGPRYAPANDDRGDPGNVNNRDQMPNQHGNREEHRHEYWFGLIREPDLD